MRNKPATPDLLVAEIAGERHGVITTLRLLAAGLSRTGIARRVATGRLHPKYRGVFGVGHTAISREGEWLAAVDACGADAVLSHLAAACLWDLLRWEDWAIDVTVPASSGRRSGRGIRVHRSKTLTSRDVVVRSAIPVTNVPRLIADLSRSANQQIYRRVLREAEYRGFCRGLPQGYVPNRSAFELMFLDFCDRHGLPRPRTRVKVGPYEADFLFEQKGLFVETDGWSAHRGRVAFESDHERDLWMKVNGFELLRITWRQVTEDGVKTGADLRAILALLPR